MEHTCECIDALVFRWKIDGDYSLEWLSLFFFRRSTSAVSGGSVVTVTVHVVLSIFELLAVVFRVLVWCSVSRSSKKMIKKKFRKNILCTWSDGAIVASWITSELLKVAGAVGAEAAAGFEPEARHYEISPCRSDRVSSKSSQTFAVITFTDNLLYLSKKWIDEGEALSSAEGNTLGREVASLGLGLRLSSHHLLLESWNGIISGEIKKCRSWIKDLRGLMVKGGGRDKLKFLRKHEVRENRVKIVFKTSIFPS